MRFNEFKVLLEEKQKLYAIGDSHAKAIGSQSGWINLASNGRSALSADNDSAIDKVVNGSLVVLSAGANDMLNPNKTTVVGRIENLINKLKQKKCTVYYVLFASTDNPKFANDRNQLRDLVASAIGTEVAVLDMGSLKYKEGSSDGIHAPMGWYVQAAQKAASGAKDYAPQTGTVVAPRQGTGSMPAAVPKPGEDKMAQAGASMVLTVPNGNMNPEIADIQKTLLELGYKLPKHGVDGVRGPETRAAVKQFQRDNGLQVDGDPGPETIGALNKLIAKKNIKFAKSTQADVKGKFASASEPQDVGDIMDDDDPAVASARKSAEKYLGREMSDGEWTALMKVTAAEENNTQAMAWVMAAILNRTNRGTWGSNVVSVVSAPYQFEPVTGASGKEQRLSSLPIPGGRKLKAILTGATEILPSVPRKIVNFTSNIDAAYKGRSSIRYKDKLLARGGEVVGNTIFAA